ncbi:MAG: transketolase [Simkaniaceae bacterium]|nr:transketolase [Simkaniaceae bacterium]
MHKENDLYNWSQMDEELQKNLEKIAGTIRGLSIEGVQKANSGHPGLPLGCADIGAYLYGHLLRHNPKDSRWENRDRFILSAGHGCMLLYSCLHLAGFDLSLDELKRFRQLHSATPGHPEFGHTDGVEATTGPLGQGVGNAVGQALGMKLLGEQFNTKEHKIFDNKVYCLAGDGCLMEGVSQESCSLAGHLGLDNLVLIFDSNHITLDGPLEQCGSEDTAGRFKAYGFDVYEMNGNDMGDIHATFCKALENQTKPVLIIAHTTIGFGSPNKAGTHKVHGSPLGEEEMKLTLEALGLSEEEFFVPQAVKNFFETKLQKDLERENAWKKTFDAWKMSNGDLYTRYETMLERKIPDDLADKLKNLKIESPIAGRSASQEVLQLLGDELPFLYGGSADLSGSDCTMMKQFPIVGKGDFKGRNIKYGIREFGMAAAAAGLFQTQMIIPYVGTFLTFSDYMRNAIRLASLSPYHVIYQFTHDSIFLGEDGPTHQPVEHYAALRAIPNLHVFRPADDFEVRGAWMSMLKYNGPSAIILTRQKLPNLGERTMNFEETVAKGAYIVHKEQGKPDFTLFATGSEVSLAVDVALALEKMGKSVRVVSMPCWELFEKQPKEYQESVAGGDLGKRVSIEAGINLGWEKWIGRDGIAICMEGFGASAPMSDLQNEFGFNVDAILARLL